MPHFRVDDALHSHPKARKAGDEALGMWTRAGSYCMAYLTDGFIPEWWVREQRRGLAKAKQLVDAGFWHPSELDGEKGWQFHEFVGPGRQDSRERIEADRKKAATRKANSRASQRESQVESRRDSHQESREIPGYTQPNPTQPINPLVNSGGGVTSVDAREPRPHCPEHETNHSGPCPACLRRRKWDEAHADAMRADELDAKRRRKWLKENCPRCEGTNTYEDADGLVRKCDPHIEVVKHG